MKSRKRILALILAGIMVIGCTACGKNETVNEGLESNENMNITDESKGTDRPSASSDIEHDAALQTPETIDLSNTYTTRFSEVNAVTYPSFMFDYPNGWAISGENVTPESELVTLTNDRGAKITYSYIGIKNPGGKSAVLMLKVDVSKAADSNFVPSNVQATDYSDLGKFIVAKLKVKGSIDMATDSEYSEIDSGTSYAVLPESYIGVHSGIRDLSFLIDFSFWYAGNVALIANAPEGVFTEQEKKEVMAILSSFRVKS